MYKKQKNVCSIFRKAVNCKDTHGFVLNEGCGPTISVAIVESFPAQVLTHLVALGLEGFNLISMGSAGDLYRSMLTHTFDIVVACSCLQDENVLSVARHLRAHSSTLSIVVVGNVDPLETGILAHENIINLTSTPADFENIKVQLLNLRRALHQVSFGGDPLEVALARGSWKLDDQAHCLTAPNGTLITLSLAESAVLSVLIGSYGEVVSRDQLLGLLAERAHLSFAHRPDSIVHSLRRKVVRRSGQPLPLLTVRNSGYVFSMDRMPD